MRAPHETPSVRFFHDSRTRPRVRSPSAREGGPTAEERPHARSSMTPHLCLLLLVALPIIAALGWGPGHHLEFAERVYRRRREMLPLDVALLLHEEREA